MFELIFGVIWELFSFPLIIAFFGALFYKEIGLSLVMALFAVIFNGLGIFLIVLGAKQIKKNKDTDKLGEECFGKVYNVQPNGTIINNQRQYEAYVEIYIPSSNEMKQTKEISGTGRSEYKVGDYVKVKYYNNDINFIGTVEKETIPSDIFSVLEKVEVNIENDTPSSQKIIYESEDVILVDGVRYKRI